MTANTENASRTFADELASFDEKLHSTADDVDLLTDIQNGIGRLLSSSENSEAEIRKVLQDRYESGELRKETFQLVKSLLDRFVTENIPTSSTGESGAPIPGSGTAAPVSIPDVPDGDDQFGATTVLPADFVIQDSAEGRVQVGSLLRDRFLLQEKISGGSMGVVYKAMDRRLAESGSNDHWVAIKVLSPQLAENGLALRALQQEAAKGRCLVHPNIVRFVDLDRDDDLYFLVMEWMPGRTLADIMDSKDSSAIDIAAAFRIVRQIGAALDYAHSRGIVHADVKPGNIMITPNGDAKLFDFGVARVRQQQAGTDFDPGVLGALTPAYSSMQVLTGEEPVAADDVFSLGCLLYRLIAGYRVFGPRNAAEASQEGMTPQRLKGLNDSQWSALKKALSYPRITRFATVREFVDELDTDQGEPFRVEEPDRFPEFEESTGSRKWLMALVLVAGLGAIAAYQYGYLDSLIDQFANQQSAAPAIATEDDISLQAPLALAPEESQSAISDADVAAFDGASSETVSEAVSDEADALSVTSSDRESEGPQFTIDEAEVTAYEADPVAATIASQTPVEGPDSMLVDFAALPPPTEIVPFTPGGRAGSPINIAVREDGPDLVIDFVRGSKLATPMTLRLEEVGFSGNRSPWGSGQYALSNSGLIQFPSGQARGRVTLTMASDPLREADQQSTLRLRDAEFANSELAVVNVTLEDDDQRKFESRLPANTVAFAVSQVSIRETDPVVQIDLVRFNPDGSEIDVDFTVSDITATEGADYFAPGSLVITFGPGQRSARLLIPLVQDADVEADEAFVVEIAADSSTAAIDVYRRIVVMIRDDDPQ